MDKRQYIYVKSDKNVVILILNVDDIVLAKHENKMYLDHLEMVILNLWDEWYGLSHCILWV